MIRSRLVRLYETLSPRELKELKRWINSPIHNQHKDVVKLFDFLASRIEITKITVKKERAFKYIFKGQEYQEKKLSYVMNYGLNTLKDFFGYKETVLDEFNFNKNLITSLQRRDSNHLALLEFKKLDHKTRNSLLKNANHSLHLFELELKKFELEGRKNRSGPTNLSHFFSHLTDFYHLSILKYACTARSHSNVTQQDYYIEALESILLTASKSQHPIILLYYNLYESFGNLENRGYYKRAGQLFLKHFEALNEQEQKEVLTLLTNYCIKQLNRVQEQYFLKECFKWYNWGLESRILIFQNILSRFTYLNIISLALKLKEFDWIFSFIEKYSPYITLEFRENYHHYSTAIVHFKQRNYDIVQRLLVQIEYDDIFLNLDAKAMLLEIYYEEKKWDALDALLISFSRYLQRKQVIAYHKQVYQNIILFTRKLMTLTPYDKVAKQELINEIKTTTLLASKREWLLDQVNKL